MPDRIRLIGIFANGAVCLIFALFAAFTLSESQAAMTTFFVAIAVLAAFNWYVVRKAAAVIAMQAAQQTELERQLAEIRPQQQEPPP